MKTISNFYEKTILESINLEGYNLPDNLNTFEKVQNVYTIFKKEYVHENNKHLHVEKLFCEWLQGLPNCLSVPYMNYEILENAENFGGFTLQTEGQRYNFLNNYYKNLSKSFFTLSTNL
jgi:hypothetical protein